MRWTTRRWWRTGSVLLALVLAAAAIAPFIDAAPFTGSIQRALESSLGRKVSFEEAHFTLLFGPGFSLSKVTIEEDPNFGLEPFAYVPTLDARVRLDRLLIGQIAFSSLRLVDPSLNLVQGEDGSWNMVELAKRLSAHSGVPLHLLPAVQVSGGRVDFKLGIRKTNVYLSDANFSVYGEDRGKLFVQFSGSPARTDRAGNGFGHLSGRVNWYPHPASEKANQLEGNLTLDRSNLSELSTLFQGEDSGVHGTISGEARIAGPAAELHVSGKFRLEDMHRWDLSPSSGEDWTVSYQGLIDLPARSIDLKTIPAESGAPTPVELAVRGTNFLLRPEWSVLANLNGAPVAGLLPLVRRMGLDLPDALKLDGTISGAVAYSTGAGWTGGVGINDFVASVPNVPAFRATTVEAHIEPDRIHLESARIASNNTGWLDVGGDYDRAGKGLHMALAMEQFPVENLRDLFANWLDWPDTLSSLQAGNFTGDLDYRWTPDKPPTWSGKFAFADGQVAVEGTAQAIMQAEGKISFTPDSMHLEKFTGLLANHRLEGSFEADEHKPDRVQVAWSGVDLAELEKLLTSGRGESWLTRLGVTRRTTPTWLMQRNIQADVELPDVSLNGDPLGVLHSRINWVGTTMQLSALRLRMPQGEITGTGTIALSGVAPRYRFTGAMSGLPWRGGLLAAEGRLDASGTGSDLLARLAAQGTFSGQDMTFSPDDSFEAMSGDFELSFADGWPKLHLNNVEATDGDEQWTGAAESQSDGKLVLDLEHAGKQRRVVSTMSPDSPAATAMRGSL